MKALIFNSGVGSRLGSLTENNPKCMLELYNGETIFERQIRLLSQCGITDFIITTGPFKEQLYRIADKFKGLNFEFVANEDYLNTNYIVSMYNARNLLDSDILLLHGDLVFNKNLVLKLIHNQDSSVCLFNENKALPEKDFKGRFKNNRLLEVSVNIFDNDCFAFQPLYKLSKTDISLWSESVAGFVESGDVKVYAENALNVITDKVNLQGMSYKDDFIDEIDNEEDYLCVNNQIKYFDYREQNIILSKNYIEILKNTLNSDDKAFIVCSKRIAVEIESQFSDIEYSIFTDFTPNPEYDDIKKGVELFNTEKHDVIISIGGGSSIDVAKCIKLFSVLDNEDDFLKNKFNYNNVRHIAVPTTAGSGSESTQFAVMYLNGTKHSVDNGSAFPDDVVLCPDVLKSLPDYQKKSTLLDALCQAVESFWSKGVTEESKKYSEKSVSLILQNYRDYIDNKQSSFCDIMFASNYSGKAINITRTTSAHSMSYKLTSTYGISHGHAVALCIVPIWKLLIEKSEFNNELRNVLLDLAQIFNTEDISEPITLISKMIESFDLPKINIVSNELDMLVSSVDVNRMQNNPVYFNNDEILKIYKEISSN